MSCQLDLGFNKKLSLKNHKINMKNEKVGMAKLLIKTKSKKQAI